MNGKNIILILAYYFLLVVLTLDPLLSLIGLPIVITASMLDKLCVGIISKSISGGIIYTILYGTAFMLVAYKFNFYPEESLIKSGIRIFSWSAIAGIVIAFFSYKSLKSKRN